MHWIQKQAKCVCFLVSEIVVVKFLQLLTPLKEMLEPLNKGSASEGYEAQGGGRAGGSGEGYSMQMQIKKNCVIQKVNLIHKTFISNAQISDQDIKYLSWNLISRVYLQVSWVLGVSAFQNINIPEGMHMHILSFIKSLFL